MHQGRCYASLTPPFISHIEEARDWEIETRWREGGREGGREGRFKGVGGKEEEH